MTDTPTPNLLAEFAEAFAIVKEKWPDAPGLPEGYKFVTNMDGTVKLCHDGEYMRIPLPTASALALCVTTAMACMAWWVSQDHYRAGAAVFGHGFDIRLYAPEVLDYATNPTNLESACLAALRAIGEP